MGEGVCFGIEPPDGWWVGLVHLDEVGITSSILKVGSGGFVLDFSVFRDSPHLGVVSRLLWLNNNITFLFGQDHIVSGSVGFLKMEPHALVLLHGGGLWLSEVFGVGWGSVAVNDFNVEVNISVEGDWFSTEWGLGVSITPGVEGWA